MSEPVGSKDKGRFYIEHLNDGFIVPYAKFKLEKETEDLVDRLKLSSGRNSNMNVGDELAVYDSTKSPDKKVFEGVITSKQETRDLWQFEVDEKIREVVDKRVKRVFRNASPETILNTLITDETSLSFTAPLASGITLDKYVVDGPIEDALDDMTTILDWQIRTTPQLEVFLEPRGRVDSGVNLKHGQNAIVKKVTTKDSDYINTVELRGGRANYKRENSFTGDGSQTVFSLSEVPESAVDVAVAGTTQQGGISEDFSDGDDFIIDQDSAELIFDTAPASGDSISVSFNYQVPILVEVSTDNAQIPANEREISKNIKRDYIKTFKNARQYAKEFVENHSRLTGTAKVERPFDKKPRIGYTADVIDNTKDVDTSLTVKKKTIKSSGDMELELGQENFNTIDWRRSVQKRIKEVQNEKTTNKILNKFKSFNLTTTTTRSVSLSVKKREMNDSFIVGNPSNGIVAESSASGGDQIVIDNFEFGDDY